MAETVRHQRGSLPRRAVRRLLMRMQRWTAPNVMPTIIHESNRTGSLEARTDTVEAWIRHFNAHMQALEARSNELDARGLAAQLRQFEIRLAELDGYRLARAEQMRRQQRLGEHYAGSLASLISRIETLQVAIDHVEAEVAEHGISQDRVITRLDELQQDTARLSAAATAFSNYQEGQQLELHELSERQHELGNTVASFGDQLEIVSRAGAGRGRLLTKLNQTITAGAGTPPAASPPNAPKLGPDHGLDALYLEFEDRARGSRLDIKERQSVYLPLLAETGAGTVDRPVLDLGAGRGEWLELLKENGFEASGVDLNAVMVGLCQELELDCVEGDALVCLKALPNESLGMLSGFHIIEHLPFEMFVALLDEAMRVLAQGGLILLETPNPANVLVGSHTFYMDPTHRNPMPSEMVRIIAEARGFAEVEIRTLHPASGQFQAQDTDLAAQLDALFYGPQDYAVIGRKR